MEFLKSTPGNDPVEIESYFAASPERVFRARLGPLKLCQSEVSFGGFRDGTEALLGRGYSASIA